MVNCSTIGCGKFTADCKTLATSKLNSGKPLLLCLNREVGHAEAGKIIRFIRGKSIVVFHCFSLLVARRLQSAVRQFVPTAVTDLASHLAF